MTSDQLRRVAEFIERLERLTNETGLRLDPGSGTLFDHLDDNTSGLSMNASIAVGTLVEDPTSLFRYGVEQ